MDRVTVSPGQIPLDVDILRTNQFAMVGNAKLAEAILGTGTQVDGFPLAPTSPASMSLTLGAGQVYEMENLEASPWSSLPADTHSILKQGLLLDVATLTFVAPSTTGFAQNVLVEVQYQDVDTGATVRPTTTRRTPRFNTTGPGGAGTADNTTRRGAVAYQIKAGTAATSGTQTTPTPDAGWVGLYVVVLSYGQTTITSGNISPYTPSSFIQKLTSTAITALVNSIIPVIVPTTRLRVLTSTDTITVPTNANAMFLEGWAPGGPGGAGNGTSQAGGGGGAGEYGKGWYSVYPGQVLSVTIPAAPSPPTTSGATGSDAGNVVITGLTSGTITIHGGGAGKGSTAGGAGGAGGVGATGVQDSVTGNAGYAGSATTGGFGGGSFGSTGGAASTASGNPGQGLGSGGAGAFNTTAANGQAAGGKVSAQFFSR